MLKLHVKHVGDEFVGAHSPCLTFLPSITGQLKTRISQISLRPIAFTSALSRAHPTIFSLVHLITQL